MALPTNILQQVQTYQESLLAYLENLNVFISIANTKFKDFEKLTANLGDTVTFDLPPRYTFTASLVAVFQPSTQRVQSLTVDQEGSVSYAFSAQQFVFNVEDYMEKFGKSAIKELSAKVEIDVAGLCETTAYRFYGNGTTPINSYGQLARMMANFRNYGAPEGEVQAILSDIAVPEIVNSGLNQFVMDRNEESAKSWMVGEFARTMWYESNLLPVHMSGTVGEAGTTLTVVSTNDPTGQNVTQITCSGAANNDADAIKQYDSAQFQDGVSGQTNVRFLTFIGQAVSAQPCQMLITADAASNGSGNVVLSITAGSGGTVGLNWAGGANQNINTPIVAGMQIKLLPSHRCGAVIGGRSLYLGMPQLPDQDPYKTAVETDSETGVSLRSYYGSLFGQNQQGYVHDCIWGKTGVAEYWMKVVFPLTQ